MAEDCLVSFKFRESTDTAKDDAVLEVSKLLFSEVSLARTDFAVEKASPEAVHHDEGPAHVDGFDFVEGFDFML